MSASNISQQNIYQSITGKEHFDETNEISSVWHFNAFRCNLVHILWTNGNRQMLNKLAFYDESPDFKY